MSDNKSNRVIALAALFQAANMVTELAKNGKCDEHYYSVLMNSLLVLSPKTTIEIYDNDLNNLHGGLTLLSELSGSNISSTHSDTARYALSILALLKELNKNPKMLETIHSRLNHMNYNNTHFSNDKTQLSSNLSALYQDTLSTLKFRIQVTGNMQFLKETSVSDRVRVMLFAGIRAAMLWRQLGGNKWQIIFGRSGIEKTSLLLLEQMSSITKH